MIGDQCLLEALGANNSAISDKKKINKREALYLKSVGGHGLCSFHLPTTCRQQFGHFLLL